MRHTVELDGLVVDCPQALEIIYGTSKNIRFTVVYKVNIIDMIIIHYSTSSAFGLSD